MPGHFGQVMAQRPKEIKARSLLMEICNFVLADNKKILFLNDADK